MCIYTQLLVVHPKRYRYGMPKHWNEKGWKKPRLRPPPCKEIPIDPPGQNSGRKCRVFFTETGEGR